MNACLRLNLDGDRFAMTSGIEYGVRSEYVHFDRDLDPGRPLRSRTAPTVACHGDGAAACSSEPEISFPWSKSRAPLLRPAPNTAMPPMTWMTRAKVYHQKIQHGACLYRQSWTAGLIFERELCSLSFRVPYAADPRAPTVSICTTNMKTRATSRSSTQFQHDLQL